MATPYLGEIRLFGFPFAPRGWAPCSGQLLAINQNQALFALLGTTYGGNGQVTFALPDLRGRLPLGISNGGSGTSPRQLGEIGGVQAVTLNVQQIPAHSHLWTATNELGDQPSPSGNYLAAASSTVAGTPNAIYAPAGGAMVALASDSIAANGNNGAHNNMMPYQVLNFCIALQGVFPSRS
jgi:microcystin-dependent protein